MKKLLSTVLLTLGMIVLIPASTLAASGKTDISGVVNLNGKPTNNASVTVTCDGTTKVTTTDKTGTYLVQFSAKNCPDGSTVNVTAAKGKKSGSNHGTVSNETSRLNVSIIDVTLPELGFVTAAGAVILSGGAFFLIRRHNLSARAQ